MAAQRKTDPAAETEPKKRKAVEPQQEGAIGAIGDVVTSAPVASPARDLQVQLRRHYTPMVHEFSSRFVTLAVTLTCLGIWLAGTSLESTL